MTTLSSVPGSLNRESGTGRGTLLEKKSAEFDDDNINFEGFAGVGMGVDVGEGEGED